MRACAEQALRNMMDMYIYFLFMYVSQSNLVLPVSLSGLITSALLMTMVLSLDKVSKAARSARVRFPQLPDCS